jgi:hypothetical protein
VPSIYQGRPLSSWNNPKLYGILQENGLLHRIEYLRISTEVLADRKMQSMLMEFTGLTDIRIEYSGEKDPNLDALNVLCRKDVFPWLRGVTLSMNWNLVNNNKYPDPDIIANILMPIVKRNAFEVSHDMFAVKRDAIKSLCLNIPFATCDIVIGCISGLRFLKELTITDMDGWVHSNSVEVLPNFFYLRKLALQDALAPDFNYIVLGCPNLRDLCCYYYKIAVILVLPTIMTLPWVATSIPRLSYITIRLNTMLDTATTILGCGIGSLRESAEIVKEQISQIRGDIIVTID